jgi:2-polyprenyl-6-hydroxyphenyl methylase/3-demethylubiquinone-9 3-methyltransferase
VTQAHPDTPVTDNVDPVEIAKFDQGAARFWDPAGPFAPLHQLNPVRLQYVKDCAPLAGRQVLDVGCAGGLLTEAMAREGAQVTGIDLATELLATAELHALESGLSIQYRAVSAEQLSQEKPAQFDVITCMEMLEHVPNPASVIAALATLVKPGGSIVLSTLNRTAKAFALAIVGAEYVAGLLPKGTHEYARFITPAECGEAARDAGLTVAGIRGLQMSLLSRRFFLGSDVSVNYLMHLTRPA